MFKTTAQRYLNYSKWCKLFFAGFLLVGIQNLEGQFSVPKVPADISKYDSECKIFSHAGIKTRSDIRYLIDEGKLTTKKYKDRIVKFTNDGRLNEVVQIDDKGRNRVIIVYKYYGNGLPQRETEFLPTGDVIGRIDYKYDENKRLIEKIVYNKYEYIINKIVFKINKNSKLVSEIHYSSPEIISGVLRWYYDDLISGKLKVMEAFEGEELLKYRKSFVYEQEKILNEEVYNPQGKKIYTIEYTYDKNDWLVKVERKSLNNTRSVMEEYQYNDRGLKITEIIYKKDGGIKSYYKYTYQQF